MPKVLHGGVGSVDGLDEPMAGIVVAVGDVVGEEPMPGIVAARATASMGSAGALEEACCFQVVKVQHIHNNIDIYKFSLVKLTL